MVNICITTRNRWDFLIKCLETIIINTRIPYRLFVYDDCSSDETTKLIRDNYNYEITQLITSNKQRGITYGFNTLWSISENYNKFYEDYKYFCYIQDDMKVMRDGWLKTLIETYETLLTKNISNIGFLSGYHAYKHPIASKIKLNGKEIYFKKSIDAKNMIATYDFLNSIGKVPRLNPDGSDRGMPGPPKKDGSRGKGSNLDVYLTGCISESRLSESSGFRSSIVQKKLCMVIPDLLKTDATKKETSTWGNEE